MLKVLKQNLLRWMVCAFLWADGTRLCFLTMSPVEFFLVPGPASFLNKQWMQEAVIAC